MPLVSQTLSEQLVNRVRDRILSGRVPANSPIRQDALAKELGISKIPLREALARLLLEGRFQSDVTRGFFVRGLNTDGAGEVYALRLRLEPDAVVLAAERATPEQHRIAIDTLATLCEVTEAGGGRVDAFNRAFHLALLQAAGQPITVNFLERLHVLSARYVRKHLEPLGRDERANEEHRQMPDAWARDSDRFRALPVAPLHKPHADLPPHPP